MTGSVRIYRWLAPGVILAALVAWGDYEISERTRLNEQAEIDGYNQAQEFPPAFPAPNKVMTRRALTQQDEVTKRIYGMLHGKMPAKNSRAARLKFAQDVANALRAEFSCAEMCARLKRLAFDDTHSKWKLYAISLDGWTDVRHGHEGQLMTGRGVKVLEAFPELACLGVEASRVNAPPVADNTTGFATSNVILKGPGTVSTHGTEVWDLGGFDPSLTVTRAAAYYQVSLTGTSNTTYYAHPNPENKGSMDRPVTVTGSCLSLWYFPTTTPTAFGSTVVSAAAEYAIHLNGTVGLMVNVADEYGTAGTGGCGVMDMSFPWRSSGVSAIQTALNRGEPFVSGGTASYSEVPIPSFAAGAGCQVQLAITCAGARWTLHNFTDGFGVGPIGTAGNQVELAWGKTGCEWISENALDSNALAGSDEPGAGLLTGTAAVPSGVTVTISERMLAINYSGC